ncbi:CheR family methyltransferase [Maledivibacter halophilus]|uniref:protein-glutamate O-methyltransferase n=1 Tax=Maledivibacter halophilus TaxID=36842 RepID=A0A1T5LAE5_9FIRM|nr:protein-glutamate O-methyltransferase CheR [Maledivibacter halophilus]SKC73007.1 chemotaxis protein methyltransferase CheR [Maledivibacter halophilus]
MVGYEDFKVKILRKTGINLSYYKERQMKRRIESLIKRNNYNAYEDYYNAMTKDKKLYNEFINYLTINVSEFFRNPNQWKVLKEEIIPRLLNDNRNRKLKVWSAACSTGEEPYTIVMTLSEFFDLKDIEVIATDLDEEAINKAKVGLYSSKSIQNSPEKFKKKYFIKTGNSYKISEEIKKCVKFKKHDLLKDSYPSNCDLIICRNVLIYFTEEAKGEIYTKFNGALKNNGVLFVGSTEQIILPNRYKFNPIKTFFYEKI